MPLPGRREAAGAAGRSTAPQAAPSEADLVFRIESIPFSRWHLKARILVGSATFFDAFDVLTLAFVLPVLIGLWHITPVQIGFLIASSYVGQLVGALLFGWVAERYGRIPSMAGAVGLMSIMAVGCALSGNFNVLFAFRFVQGIGVGGEIPVASAYINELSRGQGRGKFFLLYELTFPLGLMMTGQVGAWLVPNVGWEVMFWIGAAAGAAITVALLRQPESPRWLIAKGRLAEADQVVRLMERSTDERVTPPARTQSAIEAASADAAQRKARQSWRELLSAFYRRRTIVVWLLWATTYFIANSLNNWLPTLYKTVYHLDLQQALRAASLTNVAQVVIVLLCAFCIDRIGRRKWAVASFVTAAVVLTLLAYLGAGSVATVVVLGTLTYGIVGTMNAVLVLYTPEIYPTRMRAAGTAVATVWLRLASAVGPAIVGWLVTNNGVGAVFVVFAAVAALAAVVSSQMIETRERSLEEIAP